MTNTIYFEAYRDDDDDESDDASEKDSSRETDAVRRHPSRSFYSGIRKRVSAFILHRNSEDGVKTLSAAVDTELQRIDKNLTRFSYSELRILTGDFKLAIGDGGFGQVYKGTLSDGREVAIKKLKETSNERLTTFVTELSIIRAVQHRNLVRLYGFCTEGKHMLLVFEFLQIDLHSALHGEVLFLDWKTRYNICIGIAKGLAYLHEESIPRIIHRDVKPSNILLDFDLNPKICDFGIAKNYDDEDTQISTIVRGTMGYLDPAYYMTRQLTEKADVYSFGVTILEILCGRKVIEQGVNGKSEHVTEWVHENNCGLEVLDPSLTSFHEEQAVQMLRLALMCTELNPSCRPKMSQVVFELMRSCASEHGSSSSSTPKAHSRHLQMLTSKTPTGQTQSASNSRDADLPPDQLTPEDVDVLLGMKDLLTSFRYDELRTATGDFSPSSKLGQGGFGPVYKGILTDETEIAVKILSVTNHKWNSQFLAEIQTISAVQHHNVIKLYGYCIEAENVSLVYEYLANKSLDKALFGKNGLHLDWATRCNINLGIARGLAYFHEEMKPTVIHRDVKASNILLDNDLNPKISDFGLAKHIHDTNTHSSTRFGGTVGYIAPEYAMRGCLTEKADVYAYGVVSLEILCGRPVNDSNLGPGRTYLLELVWSLHENNCGLELVDPTLKSFNEEEAIRMLNVALLCTQASPKLRPTMSQVVSMLTGASEVTTVTQKPSYLCE